MTKKLNVFLFEDFVGHLIQDSHGELIFEYAENYLDNPNSMPLSHSLPLKKKHFLRRDCQGYFSGLLPEAGVREVIARKLNISARNDFALLEQIGGECAGAVTFLPQDQSLEENNYDYREISEKELAELFMSLPRSPLMVGEDNVRLSLAGAQDKIALYQSDEKFFVPMNGAPSTHILKPVNPRFDGLVFNEALCLQLAEAIGIPTAKAISCRVRNIDYLLVERFDRVKIQGAKKPQVKRIHQEDFCQAMGKVSEMKYQNEGGPSIINCVDLLREVSSIPVVDIKYFFDAVIYNFLIGNNDAHGKNFSLIYPKEAKKFSTRFSPLYDIVSTTYYPELSKKMAMKLGGEYHSEKVLQRHFEKMAEEMGLAKTMLKNRIQELASHILKALEMIEIREATTELVKEHIQKRCLRFV